MAAALGIGHVLAEGHDVATCPACEGDVFAGLADVSPVTLAPESGWWFHDGRTETWHGWRVSFVDRRGGKRAKRASLLLYNDGLSRLAVALAIVAYLEGRHR